MNKVKWGILSTASIGLNRVIPSMQKGELTEITAIASRNLDKARDAADKLGIPKVYGSYGELLADPDIHAVYNPLPNDMHLEWTLKAMKAGKHVLCEKPITLNAGEAETLLEACRTKPELKVMEAFMYRFHPQWLKARELVRNGTIGTLRAVHSVFTFNMTDPGNIRCKPEHGGGGMLDVGCYCVSLSRFLFGTEPRRVSAVVDLHPEWRVDRMVSAILDFEKGTSVFTCSIQTAHRQRVVILGTEGQVEIEIPFNAPVDRACRIRVETKGGTEEMLLGPADQYTIQGDGFSSAVRGNTPVPTPLEDAAANMKAIDAVFQSAKNNTWVGIQ